MKSTLSGVCRLVSSEFVCKVQLIVLCPWASTKFFTILPSPTLEGGKLVHLLPCLADLVSRELAIDLTQN